MNFRRIGYVLICGMVLIGILPLSCTVNKPLAPSIPIIFPKTEKIFLNILLRIPKELKDAKVQSQRMYMEIGEALAFHSERMARQIFSNVLLEKEEIASETLVSNKLSDYDAILTPALKATEHAHGMFIFDESVLTTLMEWTLIEPNGKLIWISTVKGEGWLEGESGIIHTRFHKTQVKALLRDLFRKSFKEISSSREIKGYSANLTNKKS